MDDNNWDMEEANPVADIKRAIELIKKDVGYIPINPILELRQRRVEDYINKRVLKFLEKKKGGKEKL